MVKVKMSKNRNNASRYTPHSYEMVYPECIGYKCFAPGEYQVRGATGASSRNTGDVLRRCLTNCYRGCPDEPEFSKELLDERKSQGWKVV